MNTATSFRYQLSDYRYAFPIFYGIMIVLYVAAGLTSQTLAQGESFTSGLETSSQWFLFVAAMCTFRQNFLVHLQLGATRKTLVKGWICAALVVDALLVLINLIILSIFLLIGLPVASTLFNWGLDPIPLRLFSNSLQMYCANLLLMSIGYLLTCGFYRLNKIGKWIVSILMGGVVLLLGNLAIQFESAVNAALDAFFTFPYTHPFLAGGFYLLAAAIIMALCWLIIRDIPERNSSAS